MTLANKPDFECYPIVQQAVGYFPWCNKCVTSKTIELLVGN